MIEWRNPPKPTGGRYGHRWREVVEELKQRPGEYALIAKDVSTSAASYLSKRYGLKCTTRGKTTSRYRVAELYAMYPKEKR